MKKSASTKFLNFVEADFYIPYLFLIYARHFVNAFLTIFPKLLGRVSILIKKDDGSICFNAGVAA